MYYVEDIMYIYTCTCYWYNIMFDAKIRFVEFTNSKVKKHKVWIEKDIHFDLLHVHVFTDMWI